MKTVCHAILLAALAVGLAGCQTHWDPQPDFGAYVNGAVQAQVQNPKAPQGMPKSVVGLDGPAADATITSYQKSFERKQAAPQSSSTGSITGSTLSVQ